MAALRIIFFGTAELARASLEALALKQEYLVVGAVTQPDRPRGRSLQLQPSAVKSAALALAISVLQPERARDAGFVSELARLAPDLIVVAAYGQILPQSILDLPPHGALNVHTSLLPKYRGAAPIQWAILEDERETGVTIMKMDAGLDTGPIVAQAETAITSEDTGATLHDRLAKLGAELLIQTIPDYVAGKAQPKPQPAEGCSYARKISKSDGLIDWSKPARAIFNQIRAFTLWPGSFTFLNEPHRQLLKISRADTVEGTGGLPGLVLDSTNGSLVIASSDGSLRVDELQIAGGKRLPVAQFLLGHPIPVGTKLG